MQMKKVIILLLLLLLLFAQSAKRQAKTPTPNPNDSNFLMSLVNTVLGGPYDAPILSRLMNKVGQFAAALIGSVFVYFKWFRKQKNRREKINEFIGQEKHGFALIAEAESRLIGQKEAEKIIYDLNSQKSRFMALSSNNGAKNFNIDVAIGEVVDESLLIYNIKMTGNDPEGRSTFTGFVTFKEKLLEIRVEQTYEGNDKKQEKPICLFSGKQMSEGVKVMKGEWWLENQRNTQGSYCGTWTFTF